MNPEANTTQYMLEECLSREFLAHGEEVGKEILRNLFSLVQLQQMAQGLNTENSDSTIPDLLIKEILEALGFRVMGIPMASTNA
jgi:hypothetical protein